MARRDVKLNVRTNPNQGFTRVEAGDTSYYYKYTGGNGGSNNGDNEFDLNERMEFKITFNGNAGTDFKFPEGAFINKDGIDDLSGVNSETEVTVTDTCLTLGDWLYGVRVTHRTSGDTFDCDPIIRHL